MGRRIKKQYVEGRPPRFILTIPGNLTDEEADQVRDRFRQVIRSGKSFIHDDDVKITPIYNEKRQQRVTTNQRKRSDRRRG